MQMIIWGFVSQHFATASPELTAGGILVSVVLVWDLLFRSHISYTLSWRKCGPATWGTFLFHHSALRS